MGLNRIVLVNLGALAAAWMLYLAWLASDARWLIWCALPVGLVGLFSAAALIVSVGGPAGVGPLATSGALAGFGIAAASLIVGVVGGESAIHRDELGLLASLLTMPWFASFGLRLRRRLVGQAAVALFVAALVAIVIRPLATAALGWLVYLAALAAYVVWALQLPRTPPAEDPAAAPSAGSWRLLDLVDGRSRWWIAAQVGWLLLIVLGLAIQVGRGDTVGLLVAMSALWLVGAWFLAGVSYAYRAARRTRQVVR